MVHPAILAAHGVGEPLVAWGLGLERLCMVLFGIPDIRLFWTDDARFLSQFASGRPDARFRPYSALPPVARDISFWIAPGDVRAGSNGAFDWSESNAFHELVRESSGDAVRSVELLDRFTRERRHSVTFRLEFAPCAGLDDPARLAALANRAMAELERLVRERLGVALR